MAPRILLLLVLAWADPGAAKSAAQPADAVTTLVLRLEQAAAAGDRTAILALGTPASARRGLDDFVATATPPAQRLVIKERDRVRTDEDGERLLIEVFAERGNEAEITTWMVDIDRDSAAPLIAAMQRLSLINGLYRLSLNASKQFDVRNLSMHATDLALELPSGSAFVAETPEGPTAVVLMGRGRMRFTPSGVAERTQLRIFDGRDSVETAFDAAFIRIRPGEFLQRFSAGAFVPREVSPRDLRRAEDIFEAYIDKTLHLDLTDLSRDRWSLTPAYGDIIAEIRTRNLGSLTYARAGKDDEDISLFDRRRRRNLSVYASPEKLAARGRFYSEDTGVDYDVLRHDIDAAFSPERLWIDGNARLKIKVRSHALTTLTLRLAEPLTVRNVVSPQFGRLLYLRVIGQNSVIVNFPTALVRGTELWLNVVYSGRIQPQFLEREAIAVAGAPAPAGGGTVGAASGEADRQEQVETAPIPLEPQYVYSNRSYWYPQSTVTDYATAHLRITVPHTFDVVASGSPVGPVAAAPGVVEPGQRARRLFVFETERPVRYLACVISRFDSIQTARLDVPSSPSPLEDADANDAVALYVKANPRQAGRARSLTERAADILEYYASIVGEAPYPSFTLAVTESELPGGHSPAYFAVLNQTLPMSPLVWRNDPVSFDNYPAFFLAHELAHQWWGQAVGWKNYHEQWLSEGFAQYFAVLYGAKDRGDGLFVSLLRQMRRWSLEESDQGPVHLGYRLGHIKADGRVFRALVYNKGAMVLHMLRRLLGDDTFFAGVRQFYMEWQFRKAGTDDFRLAMETVSGRDLSPFFDAWIYGSDVPELDFSHRVTDGTAILRFEHRRTVAPVPVTVTVTYSSGAIETMIVPVTEQVVEHTIRLTGPVRSIDANRDHGALAEIRQ